MIICSLALREKRIVRQMMFRTLTGKETRFCPFSIFPTEIFVHHLRQQGRSPGIPPIPEMEEAVLTGS
jgi:hypothetical protein